MMCYRVFFIASKEVIGHCYCSKGIVRLMLLLLLGFDDVQNHNNTASCRNTFGH